MNESVYALMWGWSKAAISRSMLIGWMVTELLQDETIRVEMGQGPVRPVGVQFCAALQLHDGASQITASHIIRKEKEGLITVISL